MADSAMPQGWELMGLRCTSSGMAADARSDRWLAEACGPADGCVRVESHSAEDALQQLTTRLRDLPNGSLPPGLGLSGNRSDRQILVLRGELGPSRSPPGGLVKLEMRAQVFDVGMPARPVSREFR